MPIKFWIPSKPYGCFSNFSKHPIVVDGKIYQTTEHYYQACKMAKLEDHEAVRVAYTPKAAKNLAYCLEMRPDWEEVKYSVMVTALTYKATQHQDIKEKLLGTGDEVLMEDSPKDSIWGIGKDGNGLNLLGKAWMEVRDNLRKNDG